jgi:predicted permease
MRGVAPKLVFLFVLGALVLNFPVLAIFNRRATLGGIPVLYLYLFGIWVAGIVAVWVLARKRWEEEE